MIKMQRDDALQEHTDGDDLALEARQLLNSVLAFKIRLPLVWKNNRYLPACHFGYSLIKFLILRRYASVADDGKFQRHRL
jgi:hypothetical protein